MKKIAALSILVMLCYPVFAGNGLSPIKLGVKAGYTLQNYNIDGALYGFTDKLTSLHSGWQAGIAVKVPLVSFISVKGELLYETSRVSYASGSGKTRHYLRTNRFSVPLLAEARIISLGQFGIHLNAGPVLNLAHNTKMDGAEEITVDALLRRPTLSLAAGGGMSFGRLNIDIRYGYHPRKASADIRYGNTTEKVTVKSAETWTLSAGILF